jgi:hypothetical protein
LLPISKKYNWAINETFFKYLRKKIKGLLKNKNAFFYTGNINKYRKFVTIILKVSAGFLREGLFTLVLIDPVV